MRMLSGLLIPEAQKGRGKYQGYEAKTVKTMTSSEEEMTRL